MVFSKCLWFPNHSIGHQVPKAPGMKQSMAPTPWDVLGTAAAVWCCSAMQQRALYGKHADLTAIVNTLQSQQNTAIFSCTEKQLVCIMVLTLPCVKVKLLTPNGLIHC